jgi:predicted GNAT superfamily acetyltransferase
VVRALAASGNVSWGASDGDRIVGFVLGWAGVDDRGLHVHSHMLASIPDSRHRGVGTALKLAQRAQALDQGIELMRWTFDPLLARNAWLNIGKLGAVIDGFERDFYGSMQDTLNQGERSDRAFIAWDLGREPGRRTPPPADDLVCEDDGEPVIVERSGNGAARVVIPAEYPKLRGAEPDRADRWRDAIATAFEACLDDGLVGRAFDRERSAYVFAEEGDAA